MCLFLNSFGSGWEATLFANWFFLTNTVTAMFLVNESGCSFFDCFFFFLEKCHKQTLISPTTTAKETAYNFR